MPTHEFPTDDHMLQLIQLLRKKMLLEYEQNPDPYDDQDVNDLLTHEGSQWTWKRFLINSYLDVDTAFVQLKSCLKWKKSMNLRGTKDSDFPREFFSSGALFPYEGDNNGSPCLIIRVKFVKRVPEILETLKLFFIHQMNKVDHQSQGYGWILIFDFTGATISNCDLDLVQFLISAICDYFPCGVDYILTFELPWLLGAVWKVIRSCIPDHSKGLVKCADRKNITDFIPVDHLPDFMGGTCDRTYRTIPDGCLSTEEFGSKVLGLSLKQQTNLLNKFKSLLQESSIGL